MKRPLFLLLFVPSLAFAVGPYYVDFGGGADSNDGLSTGTAWKHLPGDPSATGNAAGSIAAGATIYLKGGQNYAMSQANAILIDKTHYAAGGPITITSGTNVSWGSGMPVIDGNAIAQGIFDCEQMTNLTIRGINMGDTVGPVTQNSLLKIYNCLSNYIDSCTIHDACTNLSNGHADLVEPKGDNNYPSYHTITNCTIYNATQKCIEPYRAGWNNIVNNFIWSACDHGICPTSDGNQIHGNIISNCGVTVWLQAAPDPASGIKISIGVPPTSTSSNMVYNNIISHMHHGAGPLEGVSGIRLDNGQQANATAIGNRIFNNTFIDIDQHNNYAACIYFDNRQGGFTNTMILNNIMCSEATAGSVSTFTTPIALYAPCCNGALGNNNVIDFNCYFGQNANINPAFEIGGVDVGPTWANFADSGSTSPDQRFKVAVNGSGNTFPFSSQFFNVDPKFTSYPGNLALLSTSTIKSAGTNLSNFFTTDFAGSTRVNWSIGALEFSSTDPTITVQPTDQSVVSPTAATFSVTATGNSTLSYQWNWFGTNVTGATSSSWTTPATVVAQTGSSVFCAVTDLNGTLNSTTVHLFVAPAGNIIGDAIKLGAGVTLGTGVRTQ